MRLELLRGQLAGANLNGFLVTQAENRRYLAGFTGSNGVLIISPERQAVATDSRYYEQVKQQCPGWELLQVGYDFTGALPDLLREFGLSGGSVGVEAGDLSAANFLRWERAVQGQVTLVHTDGFVEELRIQKDAAEIAAIKKAIALADAAANYIIPWLKPGQTELEVAWELEVFMRTRGAEKLAFETIVASGPNSAKPHAHPSSRRLLAGEPITLDFGCVVDGYCSDITRTVCLGQPADGRYLEVWETVHRAQQAAFAGAVAGAPGCEVDKLARDVIRAAGYGDYFGHSLGHSLGLAVHEVPRYGATYTGPVPAGAVMTVEPGIYIPGWGGVRLEDVLLITGEGHQILTMADKPAVVA